MGSMAFSDMVAYVKFRHGQRAEVEDVNSENLFKRWINLSYKQLTNSKKFYGLNIEYDFPELKTECGGTDTTDGTAYIDTPTDCLYVIGVFDEDNDKHLSWVPWKWYLSQTNRDDTSSEGIPSKWTVYGAGTSAGSKRLYLHKTPGSAYEEHIYYRKRVSDMSEDTDVTSIGAEWDEIIMESAVAMGYKWFREWSNYEAVKKDLETLIAGVIGIYDYEELARNEKIRPDYAYSNNDAY